MFSQKWGPEGWWERIQPFRAGKHPELPTAPGRGVGRGRQGPDHWAPGGPWSGHKDEESWGWSRDMVPSPASRAVRVKQHQAPQSVGSGSGGGLACVCCADPRLCCGGGLGMSES